MLNFVAADCPFCYQQVPLVEKARAEYEGKGVRFVNVVMTMKKEFTAREAAEAFAEFGSRIELAKDPSNRVGRLFKVRGYPTLAIVDRTGTVTYVTSGAKRDLVSILRGQLDSLILGIATPEQRLEEAEKLHRETLQNHRRTLGEGHRDTLEAMENLAVTLTARGKRDEAERMYRQMWDVQRRFLGESDPRTLEAMHHLAVVLQDRNKFAAAEALHREALKLRRKVLGEDHPDTRLSMAHLGLALWTQDKTEEAAPYMPEVIELLRQQAMDRDATAAALNQYAWLLLTCEPAELRDPAAALPVAELAVKLGGRRDWAILDTLALAQKRNGDLAAAIETQKEAIALLPPTDFPNRTALQQTLMEYMQEAGDPAALEAWYRENLAQVREAMPPASLPVGFALTSLGAVLLEQRRYSESEPVFREVVDVARAALPPDHWRISQAESHLGLALAGQGRFEQAEPMVLGAYLHMARSPDVPAEDLRRALEHVVRLYMEWNRPDEAARFRAMMPPDDAAAKPGP